jgi:Uma2 family endonuclease
MSGGEMTTPVKAPAHYTYADYSKWPEEERWELIEGEPFNMSPAPSLTHQRVVAELLTQIRQQLRGSGCETFVAPFDVRLPKGDEAEEAVDSIVQPDIVVVCDLAQLDERGCRGAPDWIIEVLSPHTAARDQIDKRNLYEKQGVKEYWLVHPVDQVLMIYWLDKRVYGKPAIHETRGKTSSTLFPKLEIDWTLVFPQDQQ